MKKMKLGILSLSVVFAMALAGCGSTTANGTTTGNREAELEEKITQLEQQIATLEAEKTSNSAVGQTDTINQNEEVTPEASGAVTTNEGENLNKDASVDTVDSLTKEVERVVKKADATTPSKDKEKKKTEFLQLKEELDAVEDRIDAYEDYVESQYRQGDITYEEYKSKERELEALEDKLDKWEDKLERKYGLED